MPVPELTPEKKSRFLEFLEDHGNVSLAARTIGHPRQSLYKAKEADPEFSEAWDDAIDVAVSTLELEARRRALEGCEEPVFYQGVECGAVRKFSDTLAIFLLKAHRPEIYRERAQIEHSGEVKGGVVLIPQGLSPEQWEQAANASRADGDAKKS